MKYRLFLKTILLGLILYSLINCDSCKRGLKELKALNKIETNDNYYFIFEDGITKGTNTYLFKEMICNEIVKTGRKTKNEALDIFYINDNIYFSFLYNSKKRNDKVINKYVIGYIDYYSFEVNVLKYIDDLKENEKIKAFKYSSYFGLLINGVIDLYSDYNIAKSFDLITNEVRILQKDELLVLLEIQKNTNLLVIINEDLERFDFSYETDKSLIKVYDEYVIIENGIYEGYNYRNKQKVSNNVVEQILNSESQNKSSYFVYKDEKYFFDYNDDTFIVKKEDANETYFEYSMDELRNNLIEIKQIETIFNKELWFRQYYLQNNEIYVKVINDQSFFGMYNNQTPPFILLYNIENNTFEYLGYYLYTYSELLKIVRC